MQHDEFLNAAIRRGPARLRASLIEVMGGADKIMARAKQLRDEGNFLLASEIVK